LFFDQVVGKRMQIILTRGSRPEATLIPYEDYLRFQQMQESRVLARLDQVWQRLDELNAAYRDEEITADINAAIVAVENAFQTTKILWTAFFSLQGFHALRQGFIPPRFSSYCLPEIKNTINSLGGLSDGGLVPRVFFTKGHQPAQQRSLFEIETTYELDSGAVTNLEFKSLKTNISFWQYHPHPSYPNPAHYS
jgi:hypothetical protein